MNLDKKMLMYRGEQVLIIIAHLALLRWILFTLYEASTITPMKMLFHFVGMALYGAVLIRLCAYLAHRRFMNGAEKNTESGQLN
jgi:apolipoprotein N-acyltransferase